ncbi:hypothetical protein BKA66DRAFT_571155 [Pyrenochaeta sp. MPI-SDFR-AT-0127]|nr:hypothetical protein BKA66DRAFT_571155 [Pyrenochaeta sp. MPI-SDFR-AT-0127]
MSFQPVFNPFATRPKTASLRSPAVAAHAVVRDQFPITTWLLIGALIQGTASAFLPYRKIVLVLPVFLVLAFKLVSTVLVLTGICKNEMMEGVIPYRTAVVLPNEKGMPEKAGESSVCAIILAVVSHHPLGMLGPGYREVGDQFGAMVKELSNDATTHGFLGSSSWINADARTTSNEIMNILYFENEHHLHAYAHGPLHTKSMLWWRETEKSNPHLGIMHEVFACPKNTWEGIYVNYKPVGLGSLTKEVTDVNGQKSWVNSLVKIKGNLLYSKGRMGRSVGDKEWEPLTALKPSELEV